MAILDTFFLLFKTKGSEQAVKDADNVKKAFLDMASSITNVVAGVASVGKLFESLKSANNYVYELGRASQMLGVSVDDLDAWGIAVTKAGGTAAGFQASLRGLATQLGSSSAVALKVLPQLADTFHRLGQTRAFIYGKQLGLDEGTIMLLQRGRREVEATIKQQKGLGVVQKQDTDIAMKFNAQVQNTGQVFRYAFVEANRSIVPKLTEILYVLQEIGSFLGEHSDLIVGAVVAIGLAAAKSAISMKLLFSPISKATLAISLLALAYEDLMTYMKGGDSVIGRAINQFAKLSDTLGLKSFTNDLGGALYNSIQMYKKNKKDAEDALAYSGVTAGQNILSQMSLSGIGASTTSSILNTRGGSQLTNNFTGDIIVNTQATDAQGTGEAVEDKLRAMLWHPNNDHDDGIAM